MNIRASAALMKMSFIEAAAFRIYFFFTIFENSIFMIIMYFLWKAIFAGVDTDTIAGMTFMETFVYMAFAGTIMSITITYAEWTMSRDMRTGMIAISFVRPISYRAQIISRSMGDVTTNFLIIFIPSFIIVQLLSGGAVRLGLNTLLFVIAFFFAALISLLIDFLVGIISFYTESVWGISIMKEVVVRFLAGAIVPLAYFPDTARHVLEFLPFQAIYNLPIQILINNSYSTFDCVRAISIQILWLMILLGFTKLCYNRASRKVTVNGG